MSFIKVGIYPYLGIWSPKISEIKLNIKYNKTFLHIFNNNVCDENSPTMPAIHAPECIPILIFKIIE
jgi:hypothetical protein